MVQLTGSAAKCVPESNCILALTCLALARPSSPSVAWLKVLVHGRILNQK